MCCGGRGPGAVAAVRMSVLRGERRRKLCRRVAGVPLAVAGDPGRAVAPGFADQAQAGREQRVQSAGHDIRQEQQQEGQEETAVVEHMTRVGGARDVDGQRRGQRHSHAVKKSTTTGHYTRNAPDDIVTTYIYV